MGLEINEITIDRTKIGLNHPPFIVAEISGNHKGSLDRALALVKAAKESGVHAIKLQTYTPDTITLNSKENDFMILDKKSLWAGKSLYELYQEAYTPWEWHRQIFDACKRLEIIVFSTPFDETAVTFLEDLHCPCYKIGSLEIVDLPLIRAVAATGKPIILSIGGATLIEIGEAVQTARKAGCRDLVLLKCNAAYPASPSDSNLRTLPHLSECFNTLVGLSDHTLGIGVAVASVAFGSCLVEKHITLSRSEGGVDSAFSLEPEEFKLLVAETKIAWESLGGVHYGVLESEKTTLSHRPSLFFISDLKKGTIVRAEHIRSVRPASGLPPKEVDKVIGLEIKEDVKKNTPVIWDVFKM